MAVNQGTAEEKRLSEMILLSWSSRVSYGLESLFVKATSDGFSSGGSNSFAKFRCSLTLFILGLVLVLILPDTLVYFCLQ